MGRVEFQCLWSSAANIDSIYIWSTFKINGALFLLVLVPFGSDLCCQFIGIRFQNCNPIYHIYTFFTGLTISYLFYIQFKNVFYNRFILIVSSGFVLICVLNFFFVGGYLENNSISIIYLPVMCIVYCLSYFWAVIYILYI